MAPIDQARAPRRRGFLRDRAGGATVEFMVLLAPLFALLFFVVEVAIFIFHSESVRKAAEVGARLAIVSPPVVLGLPPTNAPAESGDEGHCALEPSPCATPDPARWSCAGGTGEGCTASFDAIVAEMRRFSRAIEPQNVTVTYVYGRLGRVGGPLVPTVIVDVADVTNPFGAFGLRQLIFGGVRFETVPDVRANFVAEDLN
ncbi:MAG: TadE/TadG family type IV pilus assembly protein [Pseudomonadota bacterium]